MMTTSALDEYVVRFSKLKTDKGNQWRESSETRHQAPHKALLLLSALDRYSEGAFASNLIELDENLLELFAGYWSLVMPPDRRGNIAMPFNTSGMYRGWIHPDGRRGTAVFRED